MGYENDLSNLGLLSGGAQGFIKGMQDAEDHSIRLEDQKMRKMEMDAKFRTQDQEREQQRMIRARDEAIKARTSGFRAPEGQSLGDSSPEEWQQDPEWEARQLRLNEARAGADPFGAKSATAQKTRLEIQDKQREQSRRSLSPIQGYEKSESYVGTPEEEKALRTASSEMERFNLIMNNLKSRVKAADQMALANPLSAESKAVKNDLRDLQLIYKGPAFAQLGVLAGPDMAILDDVIESPGTVSNVLAGKGGVLSRYDQAQNRVKASFAAKINSLGLTPSPQQLSAPKGKLKTGLVTEPKQGLVKEAAPVAPKGKVHISDGKEDLWIDEKDLADAAKDGFKRVK